MIAPAPPLASWRDTVARQRIIEFVEAVRGPGGLAPAERVAVFDNDGTLWCEKPLPVQAGFLLGRIAEMAEKDPSLRAGQPFKAVIEQDHAWLSNALTKHYQGDDGDLRTMAAGLLQAYDQTSVDEFAVLAREFLLHARHPTLGRRYVDCAYQPMIELLHHLRDSGFTCYIATGGGRDFVRTVSEAVFGIPPERIIGSTTALEYRDGRLVHTAKLDVFDDGPQKPVRIWSRIGRHPILAAGNADGDLPMLRAAGGAGEALRLVVVHDDGGREFAYSAGAQGVIAAAAGPQPGWQAVSMQADWSTVFPRRPVNPD
jgi:phosphoglycolate phosphatase-like HAD superfamily hydrolase